jgi:hypothetical protein
MGKPKWHGVKQRQPTSKKFWCGSSSIGPISISQGACIVFVSIKQRPLCQYLNVPRIEGVTMMATIETFKRGDEVLSKLPGGSMMTVLAVEGMKVRCSDEQDRQYWFDTILLERRYWSQPGPDATWQDPLPQSFPESHANGHCNVTSLI